MAIVGIVAVDRNLAIGRGGQLPWHYSSDMKFFRQTTIGNACVMGYKTWLTLKKPLPERLNIVLSRASEVEPQASVLIMRERAAVLQLLPFLSCDLFIIGGKQIYETFLADIDRWIVTEIPLAVEDTDTFMPANFLEGFTLTRSLQLDEGLTVKFYDKS